MTLRITQHVSAPVEAVKAFYGDVANLKRISPPFPRLTISAKDTRVQKGGEFMLILDFILFKLTWLSVIDEVVEGQYFIDSFRGSIFSLWRHKHAYSAIEGGTLLTDEIEYHPAFWFAPFATIGIKMLFAFRRRSLAEALR
jgi:ligand-binding SRPBCC domain-containing protein